MMKRVSCRQDITLVVVVTSQNHENLVVGGMWGGPCGRGLEGGRAVGGGGLGEGTPTMFGPGGVVKL